MARAPDILKLLQRSDKHYIGGGNRLLWAPPFPLYAEIPGFWDEAHFYNFELRPLFTWTLLGENGLEIPLKFISRHWDPSMLRQTYAGTTPHGTLAVKETRCIVQGDVAACDVSVEFRGKGRPAVHFVAWTAQQTRGTTGAADAAYRDDVVSFLKHASTKASPGMTLGLAFGLSRKPASHVIQLSEGALPPPRWNLTPMYEKFSAGLLPGTEQVTGIDDSGVLFMALHERLELPPGKPASTGAGLAVSPSIEESRANLKSAMHEWAPAASSAKSLYDNLAGVPHFHCSDERITKYYWYRWYGLRLNTLPGGEGNYPHPVVCEGPAAFRAPVSYSAPCHILENRWRHDPSLAQGSLMTFIANQREDGGFPGYIDPFQRRTEDFYHANWGDALLQLDAVHHSPHFLRGICDGLGRYAKYFDAERDGDGTGLYDIDNHYETGQEYMHRYTAVNPGADRENWGEVFRLKGVDATVYIYELKRALAVLTRALGKPGEAELWEIGADKIRNAVRSGMWDPVEEMFFDVDPVTSSRTNVKSATCFYPYLTDIVTAEHLPGFHRHLFNEGEFWTPFPVPSTSLDDETFCAEPEWKGKRMNCPWNGRVWPMTNSHIAEAIARCAIAFDDRNLRERGAEMIRKFIAMLFFEGDPARPNCFEHYNPLTGRPSVYRGIDDYQHSWVADLIIKYVCGIRPEGGVIVVDPFPFGLAEAAIDDVVIRGKRIRVKIERKKFAVWVDGKPAGTNTLGREIRIPSP